MSKKIRRGPNNCVLHKHESWDKNKKIFRYTIPDGAGHRIEVTASELRELREKEKELDRRLADGLDIYAGSKATVNSAFNRYIGLKKNLRGTTRKNYLYMYERYVRDGFGKNKLTEVKYSDIRIFYNALMDRGLKVSTVDSVHCMLHPVFQMAVRDNIIHVNPTDGVMAEIKRNAKDSGVRHALTPKEEEAFLEYMKVHYPDWKSEFTVLFGTGLRIGEFIGLTWENVDLEDELITVDHSVSYYKEKGDNRSEYHVFKPKTEAGIRKIPMTDDVKETFKRLRTERDMYFLPQMRPVEGLQDLIFRNRDGNIYNPASLNRVIKRIVNDYNADEELAAEREQRDPLFLPSFSNHVIRHTFCSRLCENEVNLKVIQEIMGHKDIETTMDVYAEISDEKKKNSIKGLKL